MDSTLLTATPWLTIKEAAPYARRGPRQIRKAVREGRLRATIVGNKKQILTRAEWLDRWIEDQAVPVVMPVKWRAQKRPRLPPSR